MLKRPCLVLDHDDTVVQSTPEIHYPAFAEMMHIIRPWEKIPTLEEFHEFCSEPGYFRYCDEVLHLTEAEHKIENAVWRHRVNAAVPRLYEGFLPLLTDYAAAGGTICVATHSESDLVRRDYAAHRLPAPVLLFGAELGEEKRKPNLYPLEEITRRLGFAAEEMAVVDDLMTGLSMAKQYGALAVAAGWSHLSPKVAQRVQSAADAYCRTVEELRPLLF